MFFLTNIFYILTANSHVTQLFEGESGYLVPSASRFLVESDLFLVAGRMIGHSFIHGGPRLHGLSPAVIHVLLGGSPVTVTVTLEDCPILEIISVLFNLKRVCSFSKCLLSKMVSPFIVNQWSLIYKIYMAYCLEV